MRPASDPHRPAASEPPRSGDRVSRKPALMLPIRSLGENHRARIAVHLKALDVHDRYLRFGFAATDEQIDHYVSRLDFDRDEIFGIYNRHLHLIAMAHLAYASGAGAKDSSEFGVSVLRRARGRGYGARLFERAVMNARNQGVRTMFIQMLSENTAMLRIARHAGARVEHDGAESQAYLFLSPGNLRSRLTESVRERLARANYWLKLQAKQLRQRLGRLQTARCSARPGA